MAFARKEPAVSPASRPALLGLDLGRKVEALLGPGAFSLSGKMLMVLSLILVDGLAAQIAFYLGSETYGALVGEDPALSGFSPYLSVMALTLPVGYLLLDVYRVQGQAPVERFPLRIKATCVVFVLLIGWHYASQRMLWPIGAAALTFLLAIVLPLVGEAIARTILIRRGLWGVPAVVIGAGPTGQRVVRVLQQMPELGLRPVGFFDDHPLDTASSAAVGNLPVLGSIADSARYSRRIETAIVTTPAEAHETVDMVAMQLGYRDIIVVPDLRELPTLWVRTRDLNGLIGLQMRRNLLLRRNRLLKQSIDHLIALPLFVVAAPVIAVLALWVMAVSDGSPFYVQLRAGKHGRPIRVWKLRTMHPDADARLEQYLDENPAAREEWNRYCKLSNDPRVLPGVGHFLRRTSLDELPQIFNVIRGEMSLVGPRPFPKYHLDRFDSGFQSLRSSVIPGITGLWQVSARSDGDLEVQQALDTYYIRNWSIWIDFYILSRTLGAVLAGRGAR
ncbi:MAG TPA: exopolysaccharide biosynthesis polyprenyl glycosylphosphotransferase [Dehalococcoidia bacterium]|nr:exopolysaccharide biosynthesis polyprenyl glycosylphosphotransferase [Dehalococcoidia bacterium]